MVRQGLIAVLCALTLSGCFDTVTKLTGGGSFAGTVRDGLYYQICQSGVGVGRVQRDSVLGIAAMGLPDGRTGVEIKGESTLRAEVLPLRPGFQLVGMKEDDKQTYENFLVVTAQGVTGAFATVVVSAAIERRILEADARGDVAAIRGILTTALDAGDYEVRTAYVVADLLQPAADGSTPLPAVLGPLAAAVGQPVPPCD